MELARYGHFAVPAGRTPRRAARRSELFVARIPAISERSRPDPLFLLAGGGRSLAATTFYTGVAPVFRAPTPRSGHRAHWISAAARPLSNALNCPEDSDPDAPDSPAVLTQAARDCLPMLASPRHGGRLHHPRLPCMTLDAVRVALGYSAINLYGGSYGTMAQQRLHDAIPIMCAP